MSASASALSASTKPGKPTGRRGRAPERRLAGRPRARPPGEGEPGVGMVPGHRRKGTKSSGKSFSGANRARESTRSRGRADGSVPAGPRRCGTPGSGARRHFAGSTARGCIGHGDRGVHATEAGPVHGGHRRGPVRRVVVDEVVVVMPCSVVTRRTPRRGFAAAARRSAYDRCACSTAGARRRACVAGCAATRPSRAAARRAPRPPGPRGRGAHRAGRRAGRGTSAPSRGCRARRRRACAGRPRPGR